MTFNFTLGKGFYKALHYLLKILIIYVLFHNLINLLALVLHVIDRFRVADDFEAFAAATIRGFGVIIWLMVIIGTIRNLKYRPRNVYKKGTPSPKDELAYWKAFPSHIFNFEVVWNGFSTLLGIAIWGGIILMIFDAGRDTIMSIINFLAYLVSSWFIFILISFYYLKTQREAYEPVENTLWAEDSNEVTLIIKYDALLKGKIIDGLAHLKEGHRVKLLPSDIPSEQSLTHVINETPNGPVLMDKVFSGVLVQKIKENARGGYAYGRITGFKSLKHIELTISKAPINGPYNNFDSLSLDRLFSNAALLMVQTQQGSMELIQDKLELGFDRAGRIIDQLEATGIVGPFEGSQPREVLIKGEEELKKRLDEIMKEDILGESQL